MKKIDFLKLFLKDSKVAALTASSKFVVKRIAKEIRSNHRYIVEYGAGDGVIIGEVLKKLPAEAKYFAIELNQGLVYELNKIRDNRLFIIHGDVRQIAKQLDELNLPQIDVIISGIPFSMFKPHIRREIIGNTHKHLSSDGLFIVYQFTPLIQPILKKYFSKVTVNFEPRNFLPCFIMKATK